MVCAMLSKTKHLRFASTKILQSRSLPWVQPKGSFRMTTVGFMRLLLIPYFQSGNRCQMP